MFCTNCGAQNKDEAVFCGKCGHSMNPAQHTPIVQSRRPVPSAHANRPVAAPAQAQQAFSRQAAMHAAAAKPASKKAPVVPIVIAAAVIVVAGVLVWFLLF